MSVLPNRPDSYPGNWQRRQSPFLPLAWFLTLPVLSIAFCVSLLLSSSPSEHQNHAREVVKKADLSQWDALVIMSGDGLLFEVLYTLLGVLWFRSDTIIKSSP